MSQSTFVWPLSTKGFHSLPPSTLLSKEPRGAPANMDKKNVTELASHLEARDLTDEQREIVQIMLLALSNLLIHGGNTSNQTGSSVKEIDDTGAKDDMANGATTQKIPVALQQNEHTFVQDRAPRDHSTTRLDESLIKKCLSKLTECQVPLRNLEIGFRDLSSSHRICDALCDLLDNINSMHKWFSTVLPSLVGTDVSTCHAIFTPDAEQTLIPSFQSCKDIESLLSSYEKAYGAAIELSLWLGDLYIDVVNSLNAHDGITSQQELGLVALLNRMCEDLNNLVKVTNTFITDGLPRIEAAQHNKTTHFFQSTGIIAAFFSSVTATMIQFTFQDNTTPMGIAVNTLMFSSLVFSVASVINSVLVTKWQRSTIESPKYALPGWLSVIFLEGPKAYVLLAGGLFSAGMTMFVFSSNQNAITRLVISALVGLHAVAILFFSIFFAKVAILHRFSSFSVMVVCYKNRCRWQWRNRRDSLRRLLARWGRNTGDGSATGVDIP